VKFEKICPWCKTIFHQDALETPKIYCNPKCQREKQCRLGMIKRIVKKHDTKKDMNAQCTGKNASKENESTTQKTKMKSLEKKELITQNQETKGTDQFKIKNTEKKIKKKSENENRNITQKIENEPIKTKGNGMQETENENSKKSKNDEGEMIPQSDCTQLPIVLERERSSSIQLLNDSSQHLMKLAKSLANPRTDEEGGIIQHAPAHNVDTSIKCLSELRNIMKTKLEYLKFANDIK